MLQTFLYLYTLHIWRPPLSAENCIQLDSEQHVWKQYIFWFTGTASCDALLNSVFANIPKILMRTKYKESSLNVVNSFTDGSVFSFVHEIWISSAIKQTMQLFCPMVKNFAGVKSAVRHFCLRMLYRRWPPSAGKMNFLERKSLETVTLFSCPSNSFSPTKMIQTKPFQQFRREQTQHSGKFSSWWQR